ncbi:hypothetical protein EDB83DRAFT_71047 [Lactarius deliciosus]|nr:hypothetical protein EDB83DRAFT_71047 [Lactarius deliciosus]
MHRGGSRVILRMGTPEKSVACCVYVGPLVRAREYERNVSIEAPVARALVPAPAPAVHARGTGGCTRDRSKGTFEVRGDDGRGLIETAGSGVAIRPVPESSLSSKTRRLGPNGYSAGQLLSRLLPCVTRLEEPAPAPVTRSSYSKARVSTKMCTALPYLRLKRCWGWAGVAAASFGFSHSVGGIWRQKRHWQMI